MNRSRTRTANLEVDVIVERSDNSRDQMFLLYWKVSCIELQKEYDFGAGT
ncbi:11200_t:CDS:1, partial [Acaulospora colombiana]